MAQPVRGHSGDQPRHRARLGVDLTEGGCSPSAAPGRFASLRSVPAGRRCGAGAGGRWRLRPSQAGGEGPGLRPLCSGLPRLLRAGGVGQLQDGGQRPGLRRYGSPGTPLQARPAPASFVGGREARIPEWDGVEGAGAPEVWGGGFGAGSFGIGERRCRGPGAERGNPGASWADLPGAKPAAALGRFTGVLAFVSVW